MTPQQGLAELREQIHRFEDRGCVTQPSPIFGKLSYEQWLDIHCKHADLHLSFLDPGIAESGVTAAA